jgi:signal transduction histidine kinase
MLLQSLRSRLIASFILIVVITLAAAGLALYARLGGYRDQLTAATLRQIASPIYYNLTLNRAQNTTPAGARQLRADLLDYLRLQKQDGVTVLLLDKDGNVMKESLADETLLNEHFDVPAPPARGPNFSQLPDGRHTTADGRTLLYVTVPMPTGVRLQQAGVAAIVVALPDSAGPDVYAELRQRLFFAGAIGLIAALLVAIVLWRSLYRPLGRVTGAVRSIARGDYRHRVPESGPSEVRSLAVDVNTMAASVASSQRTLRDFLANISHELKTPLTSIHGFSQAMLDGTLETPEERGRAARVIDAESRRLLLLVGELLDLSRIESGQQPMALADVTVLDLLAHVRDVFALKAGEAGVTLELRTTADAIVRADFDRIEQVLGNLVDNALRHTPRGRRVEIGARAPRGGSVQFYVTDDGDGIPPDELPHVFDRFYRSRDETAGSGAGLGLTISREIVRAHGGEIRVESPPGEGATFTFECRSQAVLRRNRLPYARPSTAFVKHAVSPC